MMGKKFNFTYSIFCLLAFLVSCDEIADKAIDGITNKAEKVIVKDIAKTLEPVLQQNVYADYTVDPKNADLHFFLKDKKGNYYKSFNRLKMDLDSSKKKLLFAMNGGMYMTNNAPLGLYIENGKRLAKLNTKSANGNFYLKPNGVFFIKKNGEAGIVTTPRFVNSTNVKYATQSGPMLVIDGNIHPAFTANSSNIKIRNGVGILPNGNLIFSITNGLSNFYDFAMHFKQAGCQNAMFLDGGISNMYLPEKSWNNLDGNFGVIIAVLANQ